MVSAAICGRALLCSEGEHVSGLYSQCETFASVDAGPPGEPWWMAFAIDGRGGLGHGAASTEVQASLFAEQFCDNPDCEIVDTTQAQCHALRAPHRGRGLLLRIAAGERGEATEFEALGAVRLLLCRGKLRPGVQPLPVRDGLPIGAANC